MEFYFFPMPCIREQLILNSFIVRRYRAAKPRPLPCTGIAFMNYHDVVSMTFRTIFVMLSFVAAHILLGLRLVILVRSFRGSSVYF
jgi:hypothetical protein